MGFVRIFSKNNVQEAYLPKISISGQTVSAIVAQLCLENSRTNPSKFFWGRPQENFKGFIWSFLSMTGLRSKRQFCPKCSFWASWTLFFQNILTNPIISGISFL